MITSKILAIFIIFTLVAATESYTPVDFMLQLPFSNMENNPFSDIFAGIIEGLDKSLKFEHSLFLTLIECPEMLVKIYNNYIKEIKSLYERGASIIDYIWVTVVSGIDAATWIYPYASYFMAFMKWYDIITNPSLITFVHASVRSSLTNCVILGSFMLGLYQVIIAGKVKEAAMFSTMITFIILVH